MNEKGIDPTVRLFNQAHVDNSVIGRKTLIGDFSRVRDSQLGAYVKVDRNNLILGSSVGDCTYTGPFDMIFQTLIGSYTSISYGVTIGPPEHNYKMLSMHPFIYDSYYDIFPNEELLRNDKFDRELIIGSDVWIGCNSTILRGVKVGNGAVIGANSLVKHDVPPYSIVVGNPAKVIKYRFNEEIIEILQSIKWWEWNKEKINKCLFLFKSELTKEKLINQLELL